MPVSTRSLFFAAAIAAPVLTAGAVQAQVNPSGYSLPLDLAMEAAAAAIKSCEASGYNVSVTIVDTAGEKKLVAKGDHSTVHTRDSSFGKAYTVVTMGPIFKIDTTSVFAARLANNPSAGALTSLPNILPLAGGVAIKAGDKIVAAIGVGGAPGGEKDEACAQAGLAKIKDRLPR